MRQEETRTTIKKAVRVNNILEAVKTSIGASMCSILLLIGAAYFFSTGDIGAALILLGMAAAFATAIWFSVALARRRNSARGQTTPFDGTGTLTTTTAQPYARTQLQAGEGIQNWLGPVKRYDMGGASTVVLGHEEHRGAENTLLITQHQLIAIALTQADFDSVQQAGFGATLSQVSTAASKASGQHIQVELLNYKLWPQLIEGFVKANPSAVLENHYQWGIPHATIRLIEVKDTFVNAGVQIHLTDGTILKYSTFLKDQISPFADAASRIGIAVSR